MANVVPLKQPRELVNYEAEVALLAAVMRVNSLYFKAAAVITPDHFADPLHGRIFAILGRMITAGRLANFLTMKAEVDADPALDGKKLDKSYAAILEGSLVTLNVDDYAYAIRDLAIRRQLIEQAKLIIARASNDLDVTAEQTAQESISHIEQLLKTGPSSGISKRDVAERIVQSIMNPPPHYPIGIPSVDDAMAGGLFVGRMIAFAARKKVGKTTMLATIAHNLNATEVPNTYYAGEMSPDEIEQKNVAYTLGINPIAFLKRPTHALARQVADYSAEVNNFTRYEEVPGIEIDDLERLMAHHIVRHGTKVHLIDYWQTIQGRRREDTQEQHQTNVAQRLANFARRNKVAIVLAAQLNQEGNSRGGEGIKLACDLYWRLCRNKGQKGTWLEMEEARHVPYRNIGNELQPQLWLHLGSHFSEDAPELKHFSEDA